MNSIQYNFGTCRFGYEGRYSDFTVEIRKNMQSSRKKNTAICHRISFFLMAKSLINAANFYLVNCETSNLQALAGESTCYILGMIMAVTGKFPNFLNLSEDFIESFMQSEDESLKNYQVYVGGLKSIMESGYTTATPEIMLAIEGYLNRILDDLNNEEFNLSLGNASWNSSISNSFDCFERVDPIPYSGEGDMRFTLGMTDAKVITLLVNMTKPGGENFDESELFIYTAIMADEEGNEQAVLCQSCRTEKVQNCMDITSEIPIRYRNPYDGKSYCFDSGEVYECDN